MKKDNQIDVYSNLAPTTEEVAKEFIEATIYTQSLPTTPNNKNVDHPPHYNQGNYEVIDVIEDWGLDFHAGNVVKYVSRYAHKGVPLQDLEKAQWYLNRLIDNVKAK